MSERNGRPGRRYDENREAWEAEELGPVQKTFSETFSAASVLKSKFFPTAPVPEAALPDRGKMVKPKLGAPSGGYGGADAAKEQLRSIVDRNPEDFADGYGDTAEELEVVGFGEEYGSEVVTVSLRAGRHYKVPLVRQSDALAIIEKLRAENERLTRERDGLVAGVSSIVNCQSSLTRSQMREAAKDLLDEHGLKVAYQGDQSPFVIRAEAAEARIHELEQMVNDEEANHQDTALRLHDAEAIIEERARTIEKLRAENYLIRNERDNLRDNLHESETRPEAAEARLAEAVEALTAIADGEGDAAVIAAQTLQSLGKEG